MRPVVRLLLNKQIVYPVLNKLIKLLFVDVAERDFIIGGRRQTDSRISLLTGIHRRDVKRIRCEIADDKPISGIASLGALLVSRWIADPDFVDEEGRPRVLQRASGPDGRSSFEALVRSVSKDIPASSVLDEWLRLGVVSQDDEHRIRLRVGAFVPEHGMEEKLHFFGRNLRDHVAAGSHNLLGEQPPFLDRSVFYDKLSSESAEKLTRMAREEGSALIWRINQRALELQIADEGSVTATHRMTFGAYFYSKDEHEDAKGNEQSGDEPSARESESGTRSGDEEE
jgi:hypothetical protein